MKDDRYYGKVTNWSRVMRAAYHAILLVQGAEVVEAEVPDALIP
jgi:hypothetical protein